MRKVNVGIIGAGPSGLLLSQLLHLSGIETIVFERQSKDYVLSRIRAGVLEWSSVEALRKAQVGERMDKEGLPHDGFFLSYGDEKHHIDLKGLTGKSVMVYGQTEVTKDLVAAREKMGGEVLYECKDVTPYDVLTSSPKIKYTHEGVTQDIECDLIIGCDGFHGVSRKTIPAANIVSYEKEYPFGWLGILSHTPPVSDELIYAKSERGFALCSLRSETLSRYYVQCPLSDDIADWSDERFWDELKLRIGTEVADKLVTGPSIEKSIAPLRSYVCETMQYGKLFIAGDAAHIVPPTGAKGLNLAFSDITILSGAIIDYYKGGSEEGLLGYTGKALSRIWKAERFSWWMSSLLHSFPDLPEFDVKIREAEFNYMVNSEAGRKTIAENYVGLPLE